MIEWHNDEGIFWRTMTPRRFNALYEAWARRTGRTPSEKKKTKKSTPGKVSLAAYMMGGGKNA